VIANDKELIQQTIQIYFDSMFYSSRDKLEKAFHASAMITGVFDGDFTEMTRDGFGDFVTSRRPSPIEKGAEARLEIVSIDISGETAVTRVRDDYLGFMFLDTLSLVKIDGQWSIYNKLYHIEGNAA